MSATHTTFATQDMVPEVVFAVPDSEDVLIGLALRDADCATNLVEHVSGEHFTVEVNRVIRLAVVALITDGHAVSLTSVVQYLTDQHVLDRAGGVAGVITRASLAVTVAEWDHHVNQLREARLRRQLQNTAEAIQGLISAPGRASEHLSAMQTIVLALEDIRSDERTVSYKSLATEAARQLNNKIAGKIPRGLPSGLDELDREWSGGQPGDLIILAGRPAMGKTILLDAFQRAALTLDDRPGSVECFSYEMSPMAMVQRGLAVYSGIPGLTSRYNNPLSNAEVDALARAECAVGELNINIHRDMPTMPGIFARCLMAKRRGPVKAIGIDYLQLIPTEPGYKEANLQPHISRLTPKLKQLAMLMECPVYLLSQLNRGVEQRENKRPRMSDLRESGSIEQDADVILFVYRDEVYHPDTPDRDIVEIICAKQRNGGLFTARQHFRGATFSMGDLTSPMNTDVRNGGHYSRPTPPPIPGNI